MSISQHKKKNQDNYQQAYFLFHSHKQHLKIVFFPIEFKRRFLNHNSSIR